MGSTGRWGWWVLAAATAACLFSTRALAFDDATAARVMELARQRHGLTTTRIPPTSYPKAGLANNTWTLVPNTDAIEWTQGFFPGALWYQYQATGDPMWRTLADRWTRNLEAQKNNRQTHDLGFKLFNSFGRAFQLTQDPFYRDVLLTAAASLASRFNDRVGVINCCDWNPAWRLPTVVDTMINLELLLWAAQNGGQPVWQEMAVRHALKTMQDMVRPDGSTFQVVDYNPDTGAIRSRGTFQGFSDNSTWARGQAWAIYGFTMVYRYTRDPRMLETARRTADFYLSRVSPDMIPKWDFDAPDTLKDTSTAAAVASGLLELSTFVDDPAAKQRYRDAALRTMDSLASPTYLSEGTNYPSLLLHGVGNRPANQEVDVGLIYGDYYFIEAILRFNPKPPAAPWQSRLNFNEAVRVLPGNTGVQNIEFDVTPQRSPIDGVVGYADSSTNVSSYAGLAMAFRMNPSGFFDVRNGGAYQATTRVNYAANTTYHVRISADLPARRYSVWVRPPGGAEVQIANGFAFRSDAPATDDLGKVGVKSGVAQDEFRVENHVVGTQGVPPPAEVWNAQLSFPPSLHALGSANTGARVIEFDVTPARSPIDGVVGYADSSTNVTAYSSLAMLVRMNPSGFFDVRNGGAYQATTQVPYRANTTYHVRITADLPARRYSVTVRPPGGVDTQIASNFVFRSDAPPIDDIGQVSVKAGISQNEFRVERHSVSGAPPVASAVAATPVQAAGVGAPGAVGCSQVPPGGAAVPVAVALLCALRAAARARAWRRRYALALAR